MKKRWFGVIAACILASACGTDASEDITLDDANSQEQSLSLLPSETRQVMSAFEVDPGMLGMLSPETLSSLSIGLDEVRPYTEFASDREHALALAQWQTNCLTMAGFPASLDSETNSINIDGDGVNEALAASEDDEYCAVEALIRFPLRPGPETDKEWSYFYDVQVAAAECLRSEGFDGAVPSLAAYIDSRGSWTAFDAIPDDIGVSDWTTLQSACSP